MKISDLSEEGFLQLIECNIELPDLSKDFSKPSENIYYNAIIGWIDQDLSHGYMESFYKTGKMMIENGGHFYDYYVYSIMFNYRHYIELALKDLLIKSQLCFNKNIEINTTHDIEKTLMLLCDILDGQDKSFLIPTEVREFILTYYYQDEKNDRYRYPYDTKGNLTNTYDHHFINLEVVYNSMELVHEYLNAVQLIYDDMDEKVDLHLLNFINKIQSFKNIEELKDKTNNKMYIIEYEAIHGSILPKEETVSQPKRYFKLDNKSLDVKIENATIPILYFDTENGSEIIIGTATYNFTENNKGVKKINSFLVEFHLS